MKMAAALVTGKDRGKAKVSAPGFLGFYNEQVAEAMRGIYVRGTSASRSTAASATLAATQLASASQQLVDVPLVHQGIGQASPSAAYPEQPQTSEPTEQEHRCSSLSMLYDRITAVQLSDRELRYLMLCPMWECGIANNESDKAEVLAAISCILPGPDASAAEKRISIHADFTWQLFVNKQLIEIDDLEELAIVSDPVDSLSLLKQLLSTVKKLEVCHGVPHVTSALSAFAAGRDEGFGLNKTKDAKTASASFKGDKAEIRRAAARSSRSYAGMAWAPGRSRAKLHGVLGFRELIHMCQATLRRAWPSLVLIII